MTVTRTSLGFSGFCVVLLIWGCSAVVCLVDEEVTEVTEQPLTSAAHHATEMYDESSVESSFSFACGNNSHSCVGYCGICEDFYHAPTMECLSTLLRHVCLSKFEASMASINSSDWCVWRNVNSLYSNLSLCTEDISDCLLIPWPNLLVEQMFVDIHSQFFKDCPTEELSDPPPVVVFALVITPICLIPVMVSLVVLKTKNGDGSS